MPTIAITRLTEGLLGVEEDSDGGDFADITEREGTANVGGDTHLIPVGVINSDRLDVINVVGAEKGEANTNAMAVEHNFTREIEGAAGRDNVVQAATRRQVQEDGS